MTQSAVRHAPQRGAGGVRNRSRMALASLGALAVLGAGVSVSAPAASATKKPNPKAKVVHKAKRGGFKMLVTAPSSASLYFAPGNTCTGSCLAIWPPLLMPAGKNAPKGSSGLGTVSFGSGQLQVTYHNMRLYTFYQDVGSTLYGVGVGGFSAAKVS
jgi:predicted lipoprotein with Yx(FWY)xxD motif